QAAAGSRRSASSTASGKTRSPTQVANSWTRAGGLVGLAFDVLRPAVLAKHEVALAVWHVVEGHRRKRLEERDAVLRVELVLDAAVHHADIARAQVTAVVANRDVDLAVDDHHHLL